MIKLFILIFAVVLTIAIASPLPGGKEVDGRVLYDQRQEGEWNVRADLKNFLILIIPTPNTSNSGTLLDLLTKSLPSRSHAKRTRPAKVTTQEAAEETQHFIESKTAPYHVDITKDHEQLAKLHPANEEVILTSSPSGALVKRELDLPLAQSARFSRAFVLTAPSEEEYTVTKTEDSRKVVKKDGKKMDKDSSTKHTLKLLGAENEQCGPEMERDDEGVCRTIKDV